MVCQRMILVDPYFAIEEKQELFFFSWQLMAHGMIFMAGESGLA